MASLLRDPLSYIRSDEYVDIDSAPRLEVRHPGYPDDNNLLLELSATDSDGHNRGIDTHIVHMACAILAGNRFDGYLSIFRNPVVTPTPTPSTLPLPLLREILPVGIYYFHVPQTANTSLPAELSPPNLLPYPVVPNFREWTFPKGHVPEAWSSAPIARPLARRTPKARDGSCRVTDQNEVTELGHIIPEGEREWFVRNCMDRYRRGPKTGPDVLGAPENILTLRPDIHFLWDRMDFSIVPKMDHQSSWVWVIHVHTVSDELCSLYHNRRLHPLSGLAWRFLLARFAWDILPMIRGFLQRDTARSLHLRNRVVNASDSECKEYCYNQGRHRSSQSPRKSPKRSHTDSARARTTHRNGEQCSDSETGSDGDGQEDDHEGNEEDEYDGQADPFGYIRRREQERLEEEQEDPDPFGHKRRREQTIAEEQYTRGRKRRRSFDSYPRRYMQDV